MMMVTGLLAAVLVVWFGFHVVGFVMEVYTYVKYAIKATARNIKSEIKYFIHSAADFAAEAMVMGYHFLISKMDRPKEV